MKLCLLAILFLAACSAPPTPIPPYSHTLVVAHRGGSALAPENTLGAFTNALQIGVDMVETDVHVSKDGELVIMHDPSVSTTTNGSGQIGDLLLADIKKLNAAAKFADAKWSPQEVPTLAQVLDTVKGKTGIQIEIKLTAGNARYPGIERKVVDQVNARGMADQVIVISFDFPTIKAIKAIDARIKTGALARADYLSSRGNNSEKIVEDVIATTGADYFMPTSGPVTEALVKAVHGRGIKIGTWTVNTAEEMRRLAGWGVDGITSDRPDELKKVLGR
ncbi:MAG: glycerophosphodiester phosphodiesterase [Chloroflexi bacterium]|nr:glycerophosphodiester phosphodiesterase [Chloroflexota bacterium]